MRLRLRALLLLFDGPERTLGAVACPGRRFYRDWPVAREDLAKLLAPRTGEARQPPGVESARLLLMAITALAVGSRYRVPRAS
jgi:hypothetical protein